MADFISLIQFRTAFPFGYLLFYILLAGLALYCLINIFKKKNEKLNSLYYLGAILLIIGYIYSSFWYSTQIELNPFFNESELLGEWKLGDSIFILKDSNQAEIQLSESLQKKIGIGNGTGHWRKHKDFNVILKTDVHSPQLRVIQFEDDYRIIIENFDDPDLWTGSLGFKRIK